MRLAAMAGLATVAVAQRAAAQAVATPTPTSTASAAPAAPLPLPVPVPPAPIIVLPDASPTAVVTPRPAPAPTKRATPQATATLSPTSTPSPAPIPAATAGAPTASPTPAPVASPAAPTPATSDTASATAGGWPIVPLAIGVALLAIGWAVFRRRRARLGEDPDDEAIAPAPAAPPAVARARLAIGFRPVRAGLNLLSAVSENEIVVANVGDARADDIRLLTQLASAHTGQDAELAAFYAAPIGRPAVPAFSLAPGEQRAVAAVAALPRDAMVTLTAAGRPMFVPIVGVNIAYRSGGIEGQLAQAFAVGVERVDSPKLAPFWLDVPPRMTDQVAARPHAAAVER